MTLPNSRIRVDLHVHSIGSWDSTLTAEQLRDACSHAGIGAVAVTEHNRFGSHAEIAERCPDLFVIPGEEIDTRDGHLIGLFMKEFIPRGLPAIETAHAIKAQGGLVYVPHPFVRLANSRLTARALEEVSPLVDVVEVWNGRGPTDAPDRRASEFARKRGFASGAGSDAHSKWEIGHGCVELDRFTGPADFLSNLGAGRVIESRSPLHAMVRGFLLASWRKVLGRDRIP